MLLRQPDRLSTLWLALLAVSLLLTYSFFNRGVSDEVVSSPDENVALFFSQQILDASTFTWHSDMNDELGVSLFQPRLAREVGENTYIGPYPQFELTLALARLYGLLDYIVGLLALLGVLGIYLLGREVAGNRAGLCAAFVYGFLVPAVLDANRFMSMVPAVSFAIISIFALLKGVRTGRGVYYWLSAIFLAGAVLIRADFVVLVLPYLIVLGVNWKSIALKHVVVSVVGFVVLTVPWYFYFYRVLPTISTQPFGLPLSAHVSAILQNLTAYPITFSNYLVLNPLPLSLIGLPALAWLMQGHKGAAYRNFAYLSLGLLVVSLLAYGDRTGTWGYWEVTPDTSMFRYFLLPYGMLSVGVAVFLTDRGWNKGFLAVAILLTAVVSLAGVSSSQVLADGRIRLERYADIKSSMAGLPEDAVLFTKSWDKIVGSRSRDLAAYRTYQDIEDNPDLAYFFQPVDVEKDLVPLVGRILDSGRAVYVLSDDTELAQALQRNGYNLQPVPKIGYEVRQPAGSS